MEHIINEKIILDAMDAMGLDMAEFCKRCGISESVLARILSNDQSVSIEDLILVADFLDIALDELFVS